MKRILLAWFLTACASAPVRGIVATDVRVIEAGTNESSRDAKLCSGFALTEAEANQYFANAKTTTAAERHYEYSWAPCYVRGTAIINGSAVQWEVEAGGLGRLVFPDGTEMLVADESKKEGQQ